MKTEVPKKINDHSYTLRCPKLKNILYNGTFFYIMPFHRFFCNLINKKNKIAISDYFYILENSLWN